MGEWFWGCLKFSMPVNTEHTLKFTSRIGTNVNPGFAARLISSTSSLL